MAVCGPEGEDEGLLGAVEGNDVVAIILVLPFDIAIISPLLRVRLVVDIFAVSVDGINVLVVVGYDAVRDAVADVELTIDLVVV